MVGFIQNDEGKQCAGKHLLVDLWGCKENLLGNEVIDVCERAAIATGATVLFKHYHDFPGCISSSGVVILAESHVTYHSFFSEGEGNYLSLDVYVCGNCDPYKAIPVFETYFQPDDIKIKMEYRGIKS